MTKRRIKVAWLRTMRRVNRWMMRKEQLTDHQQMGIKIFEKTVSIKDAEIFMSPLSDTIYIEVNDIYIILDSCDLQIINGKFQYDLHYSDSVRSRLRNRVLNILETRRIEIEKRIKSKSDRTLSSILYDVAVLKENEKLK